MGFGEPRSERAQNIEVLVISTSQKYRKVHFQSRLNATTLIEKESCLLITRVDELVTCERKMSYSRENRETILSVGT